jgi:hypothetical protein
MLESNKAQCHLQSWLPPLLWLNKKRTEPDDDEGGGPAAEEAAEEVREHLDQPRRIVAAEPTVEDVGLALVHVGEPRCPAHWFRCVCVGGGSGGVGESVARDGASAEASG